MRVPTIVVRSHVLSSWLVVSGYTQSQFAKKLGISKGRVSQLLTSTEEPSAHLIAKLILVTQLPFDRMFAVLRAVPPRVKPARQAAPEPMPAAK